jgi:hypothetical protein
MTYISNFVDQAETLLTIIGGVVALCILHYVFVPSSGTRIAVPASAVVGGYTLRWSVSHRGLRKQF